MSDLHLTLGDAASGPLRIDLETLVETRLVVYATSGGGKTGAVFQLCEICSPHVQTIIIDPEGEFSPLRSKYPFVLVGKDGDTPAAVRSAALLAVRLLELGASAIIDIFELPVKQRHEFVQKFLDALIDAPKELWPSAKGRGALVVVDESHIYAPEKGQGESVASGAMADMASRGRKRGLCLVAVTQRLAMLSKTVAANCQNVMVGRTSQIDQKRAAETLHIADNTEKMALWKELSQMHVGGFYAYGMAFGAPTPTAIQVRRAKTLPEKRGRMNLQAPPAPEAIQKLLPKLADLPQEAEKKAKTEEDLRADLRTAQQRIRDLESNKSTVDEETVAMLKEKLDELSREIGTIETRIEGFKARMAKAREIATTLMEALSEEEADKLATDYLKPIEQEIRRTMPASRPAKERTPRPPVAPVPNEGISGPEQRILNALAWMDAIGVDEPEQPAVAFLANYTYGSGGYNNPRGRLNQMGLVRYISGDKMALTAEGKKLAQYPDIDPTNDALHQAILGKLPGPEGRILTVLLKHYPRAIDSNKLAELSGYTPGSGGFNNPRGKLKTLGLVEYPQPGFVVAKSLLFPESL